ncbi:auxilin-like protein 1 isoform X1 [Pistacia vera]|uniref:auxilin-like protein 1 isoform X1 n=1 Tax=Pistacia vera TaxID=55513 RepID=UPI001262BA97|nr:auxilin-like protein 1 isoform X1 [Pistacia vera]
MEYHKVSSPTLSKKLTNSFSFGGKSIYDGVFSGPRKVVSRVEEDYGEIFSGTSSCSIPILDVPELNERKISVDVNSSKLDYSKIFGGFGEFDFGVSHEELPVKPKKRDSCIEEARTPAETGAHTSNFSVENQVLSQEATHESLDGVKQSKVFYHKTKEGGRNGINGTKNLAQYHDVPGYIRLIDEVAPSQMNGGDKPLSSVPNNTYHNRSFSGEIMKGKSSRKAVSTHSPGGAREQASGAGTRSKNKSNRSRSYSNDMPFDAYEIGLGKHPSKVSPSSTSPHNTGYNKGDSKIPMTSKFGFSNSNSSEDAADICSPPYFDEEVDANSVAAASAAAVKKAIEEAQVRIRIAKEIMERKKEGLQNHVKLRFNNVSKTKQRRESTTIDKANKFREKEWEKCKVDIQMPVAGVGTQNAKSSQVALDFTERDNLFYAKGASDETHENKNKTTPVDHKWEEVTDRMESVNECELKEESSIMNSFGKPEENGEKLEVFEAAHKQEEIERKLNVVEGACEMKECADKPKLDQEVHDREEDGKKLQPPGLLEKMEVMFKASREVEASEKKLRRFQEPTANQKNVEMQGSKYDECMKMRTPNSEQEWLENEQKQSEIFKQQENDTQSEDFPEREEDEAGPKEIFDHKKIGKEEEAACEWVEYEKQQKEACTAEENVGQSNVHCREEAEKVYDKAEDLEKIEVRMYDVHDGKKCDKKPDEGSEVMKEKIIEPEENVKKLKEAYEMTETERRQKEGCECTGSGQMQAGIDQKAEDEKIKATQEALEHCKNNLEAVINVFKQEKIGILSDTLGPSCHEENDVSLEIPTHGVNGEVMEGTQASSECKEMETELNSAEVANELETKEVSEVEIAGLAQVVLEHKETKEKVNHTTEAIASNYNRVNVGNTDMGLPQKQNDPHGEAFEIVCNGGKHVEELACESEEIFEDAEEVDAAIEQEADEDNFEFSSESWVDSGKNMEGTRLPSIFQAEEEMAEIYNDIKTSQNTERKEETYSAEGYMQKEGEIEKENLRKTDKIKEKEREKEERIAVERAVHEARERAFTEARERAERAAVEKANAEARRRAMAEARGRSEKASAEANDKTSMEARLKAERAAVERATAEARVRALEKAMSEKAAVPARNQAVKSSGAARDNGTRQSFTSNVSFCTIC